MAYGKTIPHSDPLILQHEAPHARQDPLVKNCIVVFLPNWIGDVVMATPTLRSLRQYAGPNTEIIGVMRPYIGEVLTGSSWLDESIWYHPHASDPPRRATGIIRQLRARSVAEAVLLTNSFRAAWIAWRGGATQRIGYARNGRGPLLTSRLQPPRSGRRLQPVSAVDYYLELVRTMGASVASSQMELYTTAQGELAANRVWENFGWSASDSVVALNTGGAYGAAKHWPNQHSSQLAIRLAEAGRRVLILCGPKEVEAARDIESRARHPMVRSMADQDLSLEASKACLRRSDLLVSTDSGPRHIAAAFDVPTVTLFGPIDPRWSHNYATRAIDLFDHLDCAPCGKRICPLGHHRCMNDLTPDRVFTAVTALLGQSEADQAA